MRNITIAIFIASTCLFAADAPKKPLSADFAKSGRRALIAVRNGAGQKSANVQSAVDDAEFAAATKADKATLDIIKNFQFLLEIHAVKFRLLAADDPEAVKDRERDKACGDAIEKVLRSGNLTPVPECDAQK